MVKKQTFKKAYSKELIRIAAEDLETLAVLVAASKGRKENVCFMAQQIIEKSLKAIIIYKQDPVPFTHSIDILLDHIQDTELPEAAASWASLTEFATIRRYEEGVLELDADDLKAAEEAALAAFQWAKSVVAD